MEVLYAMLKNIHLKEPVSRFIAATVARHGRYKRTKIIIESAERGVIPDDKRAFFKASDSSSAA